VRQFYNDDDDVQS